MWPVTLWLICIILIAMAHECAAWSNPETLLRRDLQLRRFRTQRYAAEGEDSYARSLKEKAEKLRRDVLELEQSKAQVGYEKLRRESEERRRQQEVRARYSAFLPILKPDGRTVDEQIQFPPYYENESSFIITCQARLPLGLVLGESESFAGAIVVDEVAAQSSGAQAGVQVGDIVRAFTACKMQMEQPAWQLIAGGIGRPKMFRYIHPVGVDKRVSFDMHLEALMSNRLDSEQRPVILVLERKEK